MRFFCPVKFLLARRCAFFPTESSFDAVLDQGLSGPLHGQTTDMQRLMNLLIRPPRSLWTLSGLEKNPRPRSFVRRRLPFGNESEEGLSFLIG
jgi:hypothetical protein